MKKEKIEKLLKTPDCLAEQGQFGNADCIECEYFEKCYKLSIAFYLWSIQSDLNAYVEHSI